MMPFINILSLNKGITIISLSKRKKSLDKFLIFLYHKRMNKSEIPFVGFFGSLKPDDAIY